MARLKFNAALPDDGGLFNVASDFSDDTVFIDAFSKTSVTVKSADSGVEYIFIGKRFTQKNDDLTGGTFTDMIVKDAHGTILFKVKDGTPSKVSEGFISHDRAPYSTLGLMGGDDRIFGSSETDILYSYQGEDKIIAGRGDDILYSYFGNPTFTGGLGSDHFLLLPKRGKATITDFDASGGGLEQDYLFFGEEMTYKAYVHGDDLWVKLDRGGSVILKDVAFSDFDLSDFRDPPPGFWVV